MANKNQLQMKHELGMYLNKRWQERCQFIKDLIDRKKQEDTELKQICDRVHEIDHDINVYTQKIDELEQKRRELKKERNSVEKDKEYRLERLGLGNTTPIVTYNVNIKENDKPCRNGSLHEEIAEFDNQTEQGKREILELE